MTELERLAKVSQNLAEVFSLLHDSNGHAGLASDAALLLKKVLDAQDFERGLVEERIKSGS